MSKAVFYFCYVMVITYGTCKAGQDKPAPT